MRPMVDLSDKIMEEFLNVFDELLLPCGDNPLTGYRDGVAILETKMLVPYSLCKGYEEFLNFQKVEVTI